MMKGLGKLLQGLRPVVLMVFVQIAYAAVNIIYKVAINDGMSMRVATAYRLTFASAFTIPAALIFDRSIHQYCLLITVSFASTLVIYFVGLTNIFSFMNFYVKFIYLK